METPIRKVCQFPVLQSVPIVALLSSQLDIMRLECCMVSLILVLLSQSIRYRLAVFLAAYPIFHQRDSHDVAIGKVIVVVDLHWWSLGCNLVDELFHTLRPIFALASPLLLESLLAFRTASYNVAHHLSLLVVLPIDLSFTKINFEFPICHCLSSNDHLLSTWMTFFTLKIPWHCLVVDISGNFIVSSMSWVV